MMTANNQHWDTVIIGGGQAGLATGYHLKQLRKEFIILESSDRVGDKWRHRWDSLRMFTPNWANGLPGLAFPGEGKGHATKDEVANFLEIYANEFQLPVLTKARVLAVTKSGDDYQVTSTRGVYTCKNVVIANGAYATPKMPAFAETLAPNISQVHSSSYKRAGDLPPGDVLVVGAGTSGIQIAMDVASSGKGVFIAGNPPARIPDFILLRLGKAFIWAMNHIMTIRTPPGRKAAEHIKKNAPGAPLIRIGIVDAMRAGVTPVPRVKGVRDGYPLLEDGVVTKVDTVIWCTGFNLDLSWIDLAGIVDSHGHPDTHRGVSNTHAGLYFVGMPFQYALTSTWLNGVGRDARYIAEYIHRVGRI